MNIVLYQPQIPHNTGAIGRICLATGSKLHLIHPLGFFIDEKSLKRAGMDYWSQIEIYEYENWECFLNKNMFFCETESKKIYTDIEYKKDDYFIFGSEGAGLPKYIIEKYSKNIIGIPMKKEARSLNLSISVAIILYKAFEKINFEGMGL